MKNFRVSNCKLIGCGVYSQVAAGAGIDPFPADERAMAERRLDSLSEKGRSAREPAVR
ncbi:MAG: hypothetical protein LBU32_29915 [Clostridiales bacterium]|nr:hypothetical protein [Clostridiales bacterium]